VPEPFAHPPRSERFEVASRGDFVPGRLWHAAAGRPPLVLIVPALGASKDAGEVEALAAAAAAAGFTAAAIDLPLQGERASPKLSARLAASDAAAPALWDEFLRQAALDLAAARAALLRRHALDPERVACVAFASGAAAAEGWAAREPRVRLVRADGKAAPAELVARLRSALAPR
jgi:pimeloyl-ACP methyl ester carboxylesterase